VVSTRAPIGYVSEAGIDLAFNQGCRGLAPVRNIDSRYFRYQLSTMTSQLGSRGQGSTFAEVSSDGLASSNVAFPPLEMQRSIADFLDSETARIDALITRKRHMIELLDTRYQVWIRSRIRHLPVADLPLKRRWRVIDCKHRTPVYVSGSGYPVVSPGDIEPGRLELARAHRFVDELDYADLTGGGRKPKRGDIIYSRNASIGIAAYVDTEQPFCMGQDVCLITSDDQDQLYLTYALNSLGVDQLQTEKLGTTLSRVNVSQILELRIPVPEPSDQRELAAIFDRQRQRVDKLVAKLTGQIELLAERRQALITAAVTGELDVAERISEQAS
jgi:type I restriction enzyme S subunit